MSAAFTPYGFADLREIMEYLSREGVSADENAAARAGNAAIGWMEQRTGRRLAARTYRTAAAITCGTATDDATVTGTGFDALNVLDDVTGVGIPPGTRIASITSATSLELTREATETDASVDLTFGSEPLIVDGTGESAIYIPEFPVIEVYSAAWASPDGTSTPLTTSNGRILDREGLYALAGDAFAKGAGNIAIECAAGYRLPSATSLGDWAETSDLARLQCRLAQVFFQDEFTSKGRIVSTSVLSQGVNIPDFRMPDDIEDGIKRYVRLH